MVLLNIVSHDFNNKVFTVGWGMLKTGDEEAYLWAFNQLSELVSTSWKPEVVVTTHDETLRKAYKVAFFLELKASCVSGMQIYASFKRLESISRKAARTLIA